MVGDELLQPANDGLHLRCGGIQLSFPAQLRKELHQAGGAAGLAGFLALLIFLPGSSIAPFFLYLGGILLQLRPVKCVKLHWYHSRL